MIIERAKPKKPLTNGHWVTIKGHHVFIGGDKQLPHGTLGAAAAAQAIFGNNQSSNVPAFQLPPNGIPVSVWQPKSATEPGGHVKVMTTGEAVTDHHVAHYGHKFGLNGAAQDVLKEAVYTGHVKTDTQLAEHVADAHYVYKMSGMALSDALKKLVEGHGAPDIANAHNASKAAQKIKEPKLSKSAHDLLISNISHGPIDAKHKSDIEHMAKDLAAKESLFLVSKEHMILAIGKHMSGHMFVTSQALTPSVSPKIKTNADVEALFSMPIAIGAKSYFPKFAKNVKKNPSVATELVQIAEAIAKKNGASGITVDHMFAALGFKGGFAEVQDKAANGNQLASQIAAQLGMPVASSTSTSSTSTSSTPTPTTQLAPHQSPQQQASQHVTLTKSSGQPLELPAHLAQSPTVHDVDALLSEGVKITANGVTALKDAIATGKITSNGQLAQVVAMAQASSKNHNYASITAGGVDHVLKEYGTVETLLDKAHGVAGASGDHQAKAIVNHLGAHSFVSQVAQQAASAAQKQQASVAAFHAASPDEHLQNKVGAQGGSNDGGLYQLPDGTQNYVKTPKNAAVAHNEHLANAIYNALGISAPQSKVFEQGGKTHYASLMVPNKGDLKNGASPDVAKELLKGFAADVLMGNWDVLGLGGDNVVTGHDGTPHRIDNGGALLFRAQGGEKAPQTLHSMGEWSDFADGKVNSRYADVFKAAGVASPEKIAGIGSQIKAIAKLRDDSGGWMGFIQKAAPDMPLSQQQKTADILEARTTLLQGKVSGIAGGNSLVGSRNFTYDSKGNQEHKIIAHQKGLVLTPDEIAAVSQHKTTPIYNSGLLGQDKLSPAALKKAKDLDSAIQKAGTIGVDSVLSRNLDLEPHEVAAFKQMQPGEVIAATPTHNSTSDTSGTFAHKNVQYCILAPKETPGIAARPHASQHSHETEIILPRGLSYRVVAVTQPGQPDAPETPQGWAWSQSAQVRLIVEPIIPGVNDYEVPAAPKANYTSEANIKHHVKSGGAKIATNLKPPNLSQLPDHIHDHLYQVPQSSP